MIGFMQLMNLCSFLIKTLKKEHIELISFDSSGERERERERERRVHITLLKLVFGYIT